MNWKTAFTAEIAEKKKRTQIAKCFLGVIYLRLFFSALSAFSAVNSASLTYYFGGDGGKGT
jgi:hypothetical protein